MTSRSRRSISPFSRPFDQALELQHQYEESPHVSRFAKLRGTTDSAQVLRDEIHACRPWDVDKLE